MRDPCEEGHHHAKRHATCTTDKRGVSFDAQLMYYGGIEVWVIEWLRTRCLSPWWNIICWIEVEDPRSTIYCFRVVLFVAEGQECNYGTNEKTRENVIQRTKE